MNLIYWLPKGIPTTANQQVGKGKCILFSQKRLVSKSAKSKQFILKLADRLVEILPIDHLTETVKMLKN